MRSPKGKRKTFGHRFRFVRWIYLFLLLGLLGRLYTIQIHSTTDFGPGVNLIDAANRQRQEVIYQKPVRGDILDRNGHTLLSEQKKVLFVFPESFQALSNETKRQIADILQLSESQLLPSVEALDDPYYLTLHGEEEPLWLSEEQVRQLQQLPVGGFTVVPWNSRYDSQMLAKHVVGFISENPELAMQRYADEVYAGKFNKHTPLGQTGLEASFDPFLKNNSNQGEVEVSFTVDSQGRPLYGYSSGVTPASNGLYPINVQTTLNAGIQKQVETILDDAGMIQGAAVVLDAGSGEILAMASRPDYDPTRIIPQKNDWNNRAVEAIAPGSIFKTVIAAAALEEQIVQLDTPFYCAGELGKYQFSCWKEGGHGELDFAEAYAQSCNIVFAQIATQLGAEKIEQYAEKLGLVQKVGWDGSLFHIDPFRQIYGEEAGQVFASETMKHDEGVLVQTAIGQRDVQLTPLQAANMLVTLLNNGEKKRTKLVQALSYQNGETMYQFPDKKIPGEGIAPRTAQTLQAMMREVVTEGTGTALLDAQWALAGKSGTAEYKTNAVLPTYHQWFVGFGPVNQPAYAVAVVNMNETNIGINKATMAFEQIMDALASLPNSS